MPPPVASWEGFTLVCMRALLGSARPGITAAKLELSEATNIAASRTSFIGGGQIGYNWQRANFVYGLEADISGLSQGPERIQIGTSPLKETHSKPILIGLALSALGPGYWCALTCWLMRLAVWLWAK